MMVVVKVSPLPGAPSISVVPSKFITKPVTAETDIEILISRIINKVDIFL
jgi:hypothetical protein